MSLGTGFKVRNSDSLTASSTSTVAARVCSLTAPSTRRASERTASSRVPPTGRSPPLNSFARTKSFCSVGRSTCGAESLSISVHAAWRKGRNADGDVFGPPGRAVLDPLSGRGDHGLSAADLNDAAFCRNPQAPPRSTTVYSSNSGVWPGSTHPEGLTILAMLIPPAPVLTRPTNSSIRFGILPALWTLAGASMRFTTPSSGPCRTDRSVRLAAQARRAAPQRTDQGASLTRRPIRIVWVSWGDHRSSVWPH